MTTMISQITETLRKIFHAVPWAFITALAITILIYLNIGKEAEPVKEQIAKEEHQKDTAKIAAPTKSLAERAMPRYQVVADSIRNANTALANDLVKQAQAKTFPWQYYLLALAALVILAFLYLRLRRMQLQEQYIKDKDPDELRMLFEKYSGQIGKLGTPRGLKRFSNRLRFQYNLLKISGVIQTEKQADYFFRIMIQAEEARNFFLMPYDEFADKFPFKTERAGNEILLQKLYEYNKNILI